MRLPIPIFLLSLIIFTAVLAVKRQKSARAQQEVNEAFLERERRANATRKQDISGLDYLPFSLEKLPVGQIQDETILAYEDTLKNLSGERIINLSSFSNTDLKLMYGPANLNDLTMYDDNYNNLSHTLFDYAKRMQELGHTEHAVAILEYAMSLSIDSSQIYLLLADLYEEMHTPEKIQGIFDALSTMDESFRSLILPKLSDLHLNHSETNTIL